MASQASRDQRGQRWRRLLFEYGLVLVGSFLTALGLDWFLVPNRIAAGGVSGLATVLFYLFRFPVGVTMLAINVPLFLIGLRVLGPRFGLKTVVGAVATGVLVDLLALFVRPLTTDPLLASVYGGVVVGVGIGLTFRVGGSTGGTDMAAQIFHRALRRSSGQTLLVFDAMVILLAGLVFSAELAMWAFLSVFITTKVIDLVQEGRATAKGAFIISQRTHDLGEAILTELDRGATSFYGRGLYTRQDREVIFVVVARWELQKLKQLVRRTDPDAFMVITDVYDVLGEGFRQEEPS